MHSTVVKTYFHRIEPHSSEFILSLWKWNLPRGFISREICWGKSFVYFRPEKPH